MQKTQPTSRFPPVPRCSNSQAFVGLPCTGFGDADVSRVVAIFLWHVDIPVRCFTCRLDTAASTSLFFAPTLAQGPFLQTLHLDLLPVAFGHV